MAVRTMEARALITARDATGATFQRVAGKMRALDSQARMTHRMMGMAGSSLIGSMTRLGAVLGPGAMVYGAKKAVENFAQLETEVKRLGVTAEASDYQVAKAMETLRRSGPPLGATAKEMATAANMYVAAGVDFEQSMEAVAPAVKAAKASGGSIEDLTNAGIAAMKQYNFTAENLERSFEIMAKAGKLGRVELKDMARLMPQIGVGAVRLGMTGEKGLAKSAAAMEILREGTASAEEAANRWDNVVQKVFINETQKKFKKMGVNLEKEIKAGAKKGEDALDVILDIIEKVTGGDQFKMASLFNDMQAQQGFQLLLRNRKKLYDFTDQILKDSAGLIETDYGRMSRTTEETFKRLTSAWDRMVGRMGESLAPLANSLAITLNDMLNKIERGETIFTRLRDLRRAEDIAAGRDPDAYDKAYQKDVDANKERYKRWFGNENGLGAAIYDYMFRGNTAEELAAARARGSAARGAIGFDAAGAAGRVTQFELSGRGNLNAARDILDRKISAEMDANNIGIQFETMGIELKAINDKLAAAASGPMFGLGSSAKGAGDWMGTPPILPGASTGLGAGFGAIGPGGKQMAIEAVVKPDQVVATLEGSADVSVKSDIKIGLDPKVFRLLEQAHAIVAESRGNIRVNGNGPGSTGKSMPEAMPGLQGGR